MSYVIGRGRYARETYPSPPSASFDPTPYLAQTAWFINYTSGNNANDGKTAATAVADASEIRRRWNGGVAGVRPTLPAITITISVTGTPPGVADPFSVLVDVDGPGTILVFQATTQPAPLHSGTLATASVFARTSAAGQITVTDAGVADWHAFNPAVLFHDKTTTGVAWLYEPFAAPNATGIITPGRAPQVAGVQAFTALTTGAAAMDQYELLPLQSIYFGTDATFRTAPGAPGTTSAQAYFYRLHLLAPVSFSVPIQVNGSGQVFWQECLIDPDVFLTRTQVMLNSWCAGTLLPTRSDGLGSTVAFSGGSYYSPFLFDGAILVEDGDFCVDATDNQPHFCQRGVASQLRMGNASWWGTSALGSIYFTVGGSYRITGGFIEATSTFYGKVGGANPIFEFGPGNVAQVLGPTVTSINFDSSTFKLDSVTQGYGIAPATGLPVGPTAFTLPHVDAALAVGTGFGGMALDPVNGARLTTYNG